MRRNTYEFVNSNRHTVQQSPHLYWIVHRSTGQPAYHQKYQKNDTENITNKIAGTLLGMFQGTVRADCRVYLPVVLAQFLDQVKAPLTSVTPSSFSILLLLPPSTSPLTFLHFCWPCLSAIFQTMLFFLHHE